MTKFSTSNLLSGKVAIVTGGGSGIGRAAAEAFVSEGAKVLVVGRREAPLKELAIKHVGNIEYIQADVSLSGSSKRIIDYTLEKFGRLDVLVNNAAAATVKPLSMITDEEIDEMLAANIKGVLALCRDATPALEKSRGSIINLSSVAGQSALPGFSAYAATKAGIDRITKILANEFGPMGIRVNAVAPGLTKTDMLAATPQEVLTKLVNEATALRRLGEPEDVGRSIAWLASDDSGWVTGQIIQASGGLLLS